MDSLEKTLPIESAEEAGELILPPKPKKKRNIVANKEEIAGTLLASIPLVGFMIFAFVPLILAFAMAFLETRGFGIDGATWAGIDNFEEVFTDEVFGKSILNTIIMGTSTILSQILALMVAYFLSKDIKGRKIFRMIYFIPYVCSVVAITLMGKYIFNSNYGIINQIFGRTGDNAIQWLDDGGLFYLTVIIISVWSGAGYGIILYTAALTNVNQSMVEAAKIDGAGSVKTFFKIVLPSISPTTFYLLVMGIIGALQSFALTNILTGNGTGPDNNGITIVYYMYRSIFTYHEMGVASASAWVLALLILAVTVFQFKFSKRWVSYD